MTYHSAARRSTLSLFLFLAFLVPQCFGVTREFTRTYPLRPDGSFELSNVNGTVRIEGWDKDEVEVRAVKTTPDKESYLDLVAIEIDARPDSLSISTRYPQEEGVEVAVDYVIHVPRRAQLSHVNNINGTLRILSSESIGELHTVNGNIEVYESSGNLHAHTTNGNVYVELKHPGDSRGAFAETTNGSVLLAIPADLHADLEARCMNGNFSSDLPMVMKGADQPRTVRGRLGGGGAPIHLGTVNGTIRVVALRSTV
jgi:putative adhesin